jgi:polyphosphate kinase
VLQEAVDPRTPLLVRVMFLAIVGSNLDVFFMKRIGGLKQQVGAGLREPTADGRTPLMQIAESLEIVRTLEGRRRGALERVLAQLATHGIEIVPYASLNDEDRAYLRTIYVDNNYPLVTPQATDPAHPFPFISNLSLNLLVALRYPSDPTPALARVKVPVGGGNPRFLQLPNRTTFVAMEDVMANNLDLLFPGMEIETCTMFRVTRNANTERDEETADDLLSMIESELRDRKFAPIVRLQVAADMSPQHRSMLVSELGLDDQADVFAVSGMLGMRDLMALAQLPFAELHDPPHHPADHPELLSERNILDLVRESGPILLHHPYQSFANSVERVLRDASRDPNVRAIKMTLYRTSADSKAMHYLIEAAQNGKQVAVVVELKARFDEAANIRWANRMEEVGIHVTYGVVGLKTHCKVILIVRQDEDGLRRYAHVGTGNYHAGTARVYCDLGLVTCDPGIGRDLTEVLNYLTTGYKPNRDYGKLLVAPKSCKTMLLKKIKREMVLHGPETPGVIQIQANALEDEDMTRALYRASQAGVRVDLIVRDTCRLRPGIPGLSENVRVISIVGRFLEHARIYYFRNGGQEEYYIGSADPMKRNLESRVEILAPVERESLQQQLRQIFDTELQDRRAAWEMQPDGSYVQRRPDSDRAKCAQTQFVETAERLLRQATRLRLRKTRGIRRNMR